LDPDHLLPPRPLAPALPLLLLELNNTSLSVSTPTRTQAGCSRAPLLFDTAWLMQICHGKKADADVMQTHA
jgi:hypothetical protein